MIQLSTPTPPAELWPHIWDSIEWVPYDLQRQVLLDRTRNKVFAAGRRAGKSQAGAHRLVPEAFRAYAELNYLRRKSLRREYWIVGPEYSDAEKEFRVAYDALDRLGFSFDHPGTYNNPESGAMQISLFNRKYIISSRSAKHPETLIGEGLSGVVFSEAAKLKPSVWEKFIRPTLADFTGWAQFGSTPEGKNWYYDLWMIGQDPERPDWASWRAPAWANPYVYRGGVNEDLFKWLAEQQKQGMLDNAVRILDEMGRMVLDEKTSIRHPQGIHPEIWAMWLDMSTESFNQEIAALFTEYVGRVFKDFDEEIHVNSDGFRAGWETWACADYGFTNPFVWLLVQTDPSHTRFHVLDEAYESGLTTEEMANIIKSRGLNPQTLRGFYPDPSEPDRTRRLEQLLKVRRMDPGSLTINDRLEWFRRKLKPGSGFGALDPLAGGGPALTVHRRCVNTIREFNDYRYKESAEQASEKGRSAPENPLKKDDHTPEALGRLFSGMLGSPYVTTRQTKAAVNR
jgi:hypothetical protein